ncbi:MAG: glycosyltransferase family 4 protein [Nitrospirales bacterium]|nr:glycosyltransferase family 4 protein [Nitrospira sp.]MDR4501889.1 glycosyltransferase family 4 protein [Nitrospirales bacterium]
MHILFLAPHPFYQDRGTPIAVNLILRVLAERGETVDVLTYHEGSQVQHPGMTLRRIRFLPFIRNIRPGFSFKKLLCDGVMMIHALLLARKHHYHVVHAVEESVFMALLIKTLFRIPYVYDMDSSLPQQMVESNVCFRPFLVMLSFCESLAIKRAKAVVPVCDVLGDLARRHGAQEVSILQDIPLLEGGCSPELSKKDVEAERERITITYVGNLEPYQGIDLLLESFSLLTRYVDHADLVIVGGTKAHIQRYEQKSRNLGIGGRVCFWGAKPTDQLAFFLAKSDILVSPRIQGNNTPMKLYSYLQSGKPIVATNLPTHTQVLTDRVAMLVGPDPEAFSRGMLCLIQDSALSQALGEAGRILVEQHYSFASFRAKVNNLYDWLASTLVSESKQEEYFHSPYSSI